MFRFHKALWSTLAAILTCLAIYMLVGGRSEEVTWPQRLKAAGIFGLLALGFALGAKREMKLEAEERAKKEPIQASETTRGK
jgi:hypothetical protein